MSALLRRVFLDLVPVLGETKGNMACFGFPVVRGIPHMILRSFFLGVGFSPFQVYSALFSGCVCACCIPFEVEAAEHAQRPFSLAAGVTG